MKICFPVLGNQGLNSPLSAQFGSAPGFLFVDTEEDGAEFVPHSAEPHEQGRCRPLEPLRGRQVDACIVGGIGSGALQQLQDAGIQVIQASSPTVRACLEAFREGERVPAGPESTCAGQGKLSHGRCREKPLVPGKTP